MRRTRCHQPKTLQRLSICTLSLLLLFLGFYSNCWNVAEQKRFLSLQAGCDSLILGRMIKSRQDGIFSAGGLTGACVPANTNTHGLSHNWLSPEQARNQYSIYSNGATCDTYSPYMSQTGGQAMIFSALDGLLPVSPPTKLILFYLLSSLLSATALTLIILWFHSEFGATAALFAACSMILSQWLIVYGRDLWWSIWAFYLPMIAVMYFLKNKRPRCAHHFIAFGTLIFMAVFVKCLINGFEFITTTLIMMFIPFVYYSIRDRLHVRLFLKGALMTIIGSCLAISLSLVILSCQIAALQGSLQDGFDHIVYVFGKRTHGEAQSYPDSVTESLEATTLQVVVRYLAGSFFDLNNYLTVSNQFVSRFLFKIRYYYLISVFLAMSIVVLFHADANCSAERRKRNIALVCATWVSMLAPLSWYGIFKAHSFMHASINFVLWQMPFTFFGFAVCGVAFRSICGQATRSRVQPAERVNQA